MEVTIFSHVHSEEGFIPEISRQSLHTYWTIFSIWDIASVAHFLTLSSSTLTASILLPAGLTSRLFAALEEAARCTYH